MSFALLVRFLAAGTGLLAVGLSPSCSCPRGSRLVGPTHDGLMDWNQPGAVQGLTHREQRLGAGSASS